MRRWRPNCPPQEQLNIDETGTKQENDKAWLWTFVARMFTVFAVRATREATALTTFLGESFHGIVTCDRAKMYWHLGSLQWCWAHLKRDFQAMIDSGDPRAKHLGCRLRHATCELFEHWADYRAGQNFAGGIAASDGTRPPQRGAFAAARHPMRSRRYARHVPGIVRTSLRGCGRSCVTKGSNRRTMRASGRCVMR